MHSCHMIFFFFLKGLKIQRNPLFFLTAKVKPMVNVKETKNTRAVCQSERDWELSNERHTGSGSLLLISSNLIWNLMIQRRDLRFNLIQGLSESAHEIKNNQLANKAEVVSPRLS